MQAQIAAAQSNWRRAYEAATFQAGRIEDRDAEDGDDSESAEESDGLRLGEAQRNVSPAVERPVKRARVDEGKDIGVCLSVSNFLRIIFY